MSRDVVNSLKGQYDRVAGFLEKFIEVSPDKIWGGTSGKFPVWQHVYHAFECVGFFLASKDAAPNKESLYPLEVNLFKIIPDAPAEKAKIAKIAKEYNAFAAEFFASLTDADLAKPHEGLSSRINAPFNNAGVITLLIGHMYYHFGHCDAALRDNGLEGLF